MQDTHQQNTELDRVIAATNQYNKDLAKYLKGTLPKWKVFDLGVPAGDLAKHLDGGHIFMTQKMFTKAQKEHDSIITIEQLRDLPLKLYQSSAIFKSKKEGSIVVAITERDNIDNPVVIPINMRGTIFNGKQGVQANLITSIHGRPQRHLDLWEEEGLRLDTNKITRSEQQGTIPCVETSEKRDTKVRQNFQITNLNEKDMQKDFTDNASKPHTDVHSDLEKFGRYAEAFADKSRRAGKFLDVEGENALVLPVEAREFLTAQVDKYAENSEVTAKQVGALMRCRRALQGCPENKEIADAFLRTQYAQKRGITGAVPKDLETATPLHVVLLDAEISVCPQKKQAQRLLGVQKQIEKRLGKETAPSFWERYENIRKELTLKNLAIAPFRLAKAAIEYVRSERAKRLLEKADNGQAQIILEQAKQKAASSVRTKPKLLEQWKAVPYEQVKANERAKRKTAPPVRKEKAARLPPPSRSHSQRGGREEGAAHMPPPPSHSQMGGWEESAAHLPPPPPPPSHSQMGGWEESAAHMPPPPHSQMEEWEESAAHMPPPNCPPPSVQERLMQFNDRLAQRERTAAKTLNINHNQGKAL